MSILSSVVTVKTTKIIVSTDVYMAVPFLVKPKKVKGKMSIFLRQDRVQVILEKVVMNVMNCN